MAVQLADEISYTALSSKLSQVQYEISQSRISYQYGT